MEDTITLVAFHENRWISDARFRPRIDLEIVISGDLLRRQREGKVFNHVERTNVNLTPASARKLPCPLALPQPQVELSHRTR